MYTATSRRGLAAFLAPVLLILAASDLAAQSSIVRFDLGEYPNAVAILEATGFDPHHEAASYAPVGSFDLVVPDSDLLRLAELGMDFLVVEQSISMNDYVNLVDAPAAQFYDWGELEAEMAALAVQYPGIATKVDLTALTGAPMTHEGRHISALKISDNVASDEDEPNLLYVGNHHAREIATPAHMVQWMRDLCAGYGSDPQVTAAVDGNEIWVIPTLNPDGLEHVWNVDQYWRKNRRNNGNGTWGVDLNRNYPFDWAACGSYSYSGGSQTYVGPSAGSEPETQTLMGLARQRRFAKVIDIHQSGREVLYPYACSSMPSAARDKVIEMRDTLASAANYSHRPPSAGGEHFEWEFAEIGALSYLIELNTTFFPTWSSFQSEYARVKPAYEAMLFEPLPAAGHVYDAATGAPIDDADIAIAGVNWSNGETRGSGGGFGRWALWLRDGLWNATVDAPGYASQVLALETSGAGETLDVWLQPLSGPTLTTLTPPTAGSTFQFAVDNAATWAGGRAHIVLSSTDGGPFSVGTPIAGGFTVPIVQDSVTNWSQAQSALRPLIGGNGTAYTLPVLVPPTVSGWSIWASAVIVQGGVQAVTPALPFVVQ